MMNPAEGICEVSAVAVEAIRTGGIAPDFILPNFDGRCVRLYSELDRGPVVLVFYCGGWCPLCSTRLRGFQGILGGFDAAGAQLAAISPQLPDRSLTTRENEGLAFSVLSDIGLHAADNYGIASELPQALVGLHGNLDVSLDAYNGVDGGNRLPVPATFVVRPDRTVAFAHVPFGHTRRTEPLGVLACIREL